MFLKFDMRHGHESHSDMRHDHFLNSICDMGINKRQRHATLIFLKIYRRHGYPPSRAPSIALAWECPADSNRYIPVNSLSRDPLATM